MSHATINRAALDPDLRTRVDAAIYKELSFDEEKRASVFGQQVLQGAGQFTAFYWRVAVDSEAAYETALTMGRGAPGHDPDVITDGAITAAVAAAWPADPVPPTP